MDMSYNALKVTIEWTVFIIIIIMRRMIHVQNVPANDSSFLIWIITCLTAKVVVDFEQAVSTRALS